MKKRIILLILVLLLTLAIAAPAFADPGGPCKNVTGSGQFWGWRQGNMQLDKFGEAKGRFYGPGHGYLTSCK